MMKPCIDGGLVPARCWYYLLEWKDVNYTQFCDDTGKDSVQNLTMKEFWDIFKTATAQEEELNIFNNS